MRETASSGMAACAAFEHSCNYRRGEGEGGEGEKTGCECPVQQINAYTYITHE